MAIQAPFTYSAELTAIALAYRNQRMVADMVLPRVPVGAPSFKWSKHTLGDSYTIPKTKVGRKSRPMEVDWSATEQTASVEDYALDDAIPNSDIEVARSQLSVYGRQPIDPRESSVMVLTDLIELAREKRVADIVFNASAYASTTNKSTLSGTTQWSHASSDPINAILTAMDGMLIRPNKAVMGQEVWTKLRQHAKVVAAVAPMGGNAATGGVAMREAVAELLELDEIIIGASRINTAVMGQTPTLSRVWGKHCVLFYQAPVIASVTGTLTYGFTGQFGERISGTIANDPDIGMRGGERVRVGESVKELLASADAGYMFIDAVA